MSMRPYHQRPPRFFRRTTAAVRTFAAGLMLFAVSAKSQEVLFKETF